MKAFKMYTSLYNDYGLSVVFDFLSRFRSGEMVMGVFDYTVFNTLMKGVMCGMLMFIAVDFYKTKGSFIATFVAVPVFIMAGFEHSIADMYYFTSAMMWDLDAVLFIILIIIGNALGGIMIPAYRLYINGERKKEPQ